MKTIHKIIPIGRFCERISEKEAVQYRRLWKYTVAITAFVSLAPLIIMTIINYNQYQKALKTEIVNRVSWLTRNTGESLEFFLEERRFALNFIITDKRFKELANQEQLESMFINLKGSFGGFVDMGVIDSNGCQLSYVGPYNLQGKNYIDQDWFNEVSIRGNYVSDVFMGYRHFPHFVIAVKKEKKGGGFYVLRTTVDTEILKQATRSLNLGYSSDAFIVNHSGILQTPSRFHGNTLEKCKISTPPDSANAEILETQNERGERVVLGYAYIEKSPFILLLIRPHRELMKNWLFLRGDLLWFFVFSMVLILIVILWASTHLVTRIYEADLERARYAHNIEYTSRLASMGRLAAGVAHEINNPLAIINENAGLLKDLALLTKDFPQEAKIVKIVDSIINSVERCSNITHRLLGFAKRMDVQTKTIDIELLLKEVLSFLEKEAAYRNLSINFHVPENFPTIASDRSQLQQVFLNIINNAFAAVDDGGKIDISMEQNQKNSIIVMIRDNGHGISKENLTHIFEPFFTTKKEHGTGLGLSITYGIVKKLGGDIDVNSKVGDGSEFTITLPIVNYPWTKDPGA